MKKYIVSTILFSISAGSLSYGGLLNGNSPTADGCVSRGGGYYHNGDINAFCAVVSTTSSIPTIIIEDKEVQWESPDIQVRLVSEAAEYLSNSASNNNAGEHAVISAIANKLETSEENVAKAVVAIHTTDENQVITLENIQKGIAK